MREAEVRDLRRLAVGDEDIVGLEVAVDDAAFVGMLDAARGLLEERDRLPGAARQLGDDGAERAALDELHHEKEPLAALADVVHLHHVRVVHAGERLRLAVEALADLVERHEAVAQELQRDGTVELPVDAAVHGRDGALAELVADLVARGERVAAGRHGAVDLAEELVNLRRTQPAAGDEELLGVLVGGVGEDLLDLCGAEEAFLDGEVAETAAPGRGEIGADAVEEVRRSSRHGPIRREGR